MNNDNIPNHCDGKQIVLMFFVSIAWIVFKAWAETL